MAALVPYKPLYQALVVISLVVGIWGIPVTVSLVRGGEKVYRNALLVLLLGAISAGIQMGVSQSVRGASAPVNMRFFLTLFTLAVFLLLRLPPVWRRVDFTQPLKGGSTGASAGTALIVCGIITLTTPLWAGPTHLSPMGDNWVSALQTPLTVSGSGMLLADVVLPLAGQTSGMAVTALHGVAQCYIPIASRCIAHPRSLQSPRPVSRGWHPGPAPLPTSRYRPSAASAPMTPLPHSGPDPCPDR